MTAKRTLTPNNPIRLGYTPLCDCAPLAVAQELGLFLEEGLEIRLERQNSWATARDLIRIGALQGGHMLAPAVVADWMEGGGRDLVAPMGLSLNGTCIAVSLRLWEAMSAYASAPIQDAQSLISTLGALAQARRERGEPAFRAAAVFRESSHYLDLTRIFVAGGLDLTRDVRIGIVPPPEMEAFLERDLIDIFCVGEPWASLAVSRGAGRIVATSLDFGANRLEKVLAVGSDFAETSPAALQAVMRALLRAAMWIDAPDNRAAAARLLVEGGYVDAPLDLVERAFTGWIQRAPGAPYEHAPDFLVFHRHNANVLRVEDAVALAEAMAGAGLAIPGGRAEAAFRPDLFSQAARAVDPIIAL